MNGDRMQSSNKIFPQPFFLSLVFVVGLIGSRTAYGQADIGVELDHIQRLDEEGRWLEALEETDLLMQLASKQVRAGGQNANLYYTLAVLRSQLAVRTGNFAVAEKAIKEADGLGSDIGFRNMLAAMAPPADDGREATMQRRREYEATLLIRDFMLDDSRALLALATNKLDEAENLVNVNFQRRRAGGGGGRLLAVRELKKFAVVSPRKLTALSTFEPSRQAVMVYLKKQQFSRARSYMLDAKKAAETVLADAFPRGEDGRALVAEWPAGDDPPSLEQREAARLRAIVSELRGVVEAGDGNSESADAAFSQAIDLYRRGYETEHPESLLTLIAAAKFAIDRADQAKQRRDLKTAAARAKKAASLLARADRLMDMSVASQGVARLEFSDLSARIAGLSSSSETLSTMEVAEMAAREALRSLSRYKTAGAVPIARPSSAPPPAATN
jgi:hypothetical protein